MIRESDGRIIVSSVSPGSVAHRSGSIQSGDRLIAINNTRIDSMTVDQALLALNGTDVQVIRLKLYKGELKGEPEEQPPVVYTVELIRHGGPLGVTISGTESPDDPITISGITEGIVYRT
jgi:C-terminal processing protease CtpA/Prc